MPPITHEPQLTIPVNPSNTTETLEPKSPSIPKIAIPSNTTQSSETQEVTQRNETASPWGKLIDQPYKVVKQPSDKKSSETELLRNSTVSEQASPPSLTDTEVGKS